MLEHDADSFFPATADEAMRITGLNLRSLFDRFPVAVQVYLPDGRGIYRNPAHIALWGPPVDDDETSVVFDSPTLAALGLMPYIRSGFGGETVALPVTRYTAAEEPRLQDRPPIWLQTLIYPITDEIGTLRAVVVMHLDVTEREEAQRLLEERVEERTRETSTLLKVSQTISSTLDLKSLLDLILEQLKVVADYTGSVVILVEDGMFRIVDDRSGIAPGEPNPELIGTQWPVSQGGKLWETLSALRPVVIDDVLGDSDMARAFRERTRASSDTASIRNVRSWLAVPLVAGDRAIGFIGISKNTPGYYTEHHARLAMAIAAQAATAIENARLYEGQRRAAGELATLLEVARNVSSTLELQPLFGLILDQLKRVVDYTSATVATRDGDQYVIHEYRGPLPREVVLSRPLPADALAEAMAGTPEDEPRIIADIWDETPTARAYRAVRGEEYLRTTASYLRCLLIAPLNHKGQTVGGLTLTHQTPGFFTSHHAALAQAVADQVAGAVQNARSFEHERRTSEELATLLEISRTVSSTLELEPLLGLILDQIKLVLDYTSALVLTVDGEDVRAREYRGPLPREVVLSRQTATKMTPEAEVRLYRGEPVIIPDVWDDSAEARLYRSQMGEEYLRTTASYLKCLLVAPLVHKGNLRGALVLTHETPGYYTERHATLAQTMANQVTSAVENARLFEQARKLAAMEERQRLARELHDSVSQVLFSIGLGARTARTLLERDDSTRAMTSTEYILNLAEMGMAEMRALLFELRPESLEQEGLVAAITKQVEALRARHGIDVAADLRDEPLVSLETKEALYRIAQEAMHNTVKHAGASRIEVQLDRRPDGLVLEVRDNGRGFDTTGSFPGHLGLRSMRERVTRVGGALDLRSAPEKGTTIRVQVPMHA